MSPQYPETSTVKVWDPFVRIFHWSLVLLFLIAFMTEDDSLNLHVLVGYAISLLIGFRLFWGWVGPHRARFLTFVKSPAVTIDYLRKMVSFRVPHYLGHNPVGAVMVIALLLSIALVSFTGMIIIASEGHGPLSGTFFSSWQYESMEDVHEFFANLTLLMVIAHIFGVIFSSYLEGENLVKAMVTGQKKNRPHWEDANPRKGRK